MKTSIIVSIVVVIVVALGAWYLFTPHTVGAPGQTPNGALGTNGSPNQDNMGGADTGMQDNGVMGDGTTVGQNLILGLNNSPDVGDYLSGYNGMTVYTYSPDKQSPGKSACNGTCAANWPPYVVPSAADIHVSAATTGTVSTITRDDGTLQVTYNGMPLYFYVKDKQPADTTGQGVGNVWYVAKP